MEGTTTKDCALEALGEGLFYFAYNGVVYKKVLLKEGEHRMNFSAAPAANKIKAFGPIFPLALLIAFTLYFSLFLVPSASRVAHAGYECEETIGQTCKSPPYRIEPYNDPKQPNAKVMRFWPDEPVDQLSDGCTVVFYVDRSQEQVGVALQGTCNTTTDVQAQNDCVAYLDYWVRVASDGGGRFLWISQSAARCPWSDGSNEITMLQTLQGVPSDPAATSKLELKTQGTLRSPIVISREELEALEDPSAAPPSKQ